MGELKRYVLFLILTGFLGWASCTHYPICQSSIPELAAIDSLLWTQPDSAFAQLLAFADSPEMDSLNTFNEHYFHLLLSELLYKNDYAQTNRNELLQAVDYYDSLVAASGAHVEKDIVFLDARVHYMDGVGYYEMDSAIPACREYLQAVELMEERFSEEELAGERAQFMALAFTHLTVVFSDQYLHEQAIYYGKCSLAYYKRHKAASWHLAWMLNEIGSQFDMMNLCDSADYYYHEALRNIADTNTLTYRIVSSHLAFLAYQKTNDSKPFLTRLYHLLDLAENEKEYYSRCLTIGEVYYHERLNDSALLYLTKVFDHSTSLNSKKQAAEWLVEVYKTLGRDAEIIEYADFLVPFANENENKGTVKSELAQYHNVYCQQKQQRLHKFETTSRMKWGGLLVGGVMIITLVYLTLYHRSKRHKQCLEARVLEERRAHEIQQKAMAGRLKQSNKMLRELKDKARKQEVDDLANHYETASSFKDEPICQYIVEVTNDLRNPIKSTVPISTYASIALTNEQISQLSDAFERHYHRLYLKLIEAYPNLKDKDLTYCHLCLLGLNNTQIAALLQKSQSAIWDREQRLHRIFGKKEPISVIINRL